MNPASEHQPLMTRLHSLKSVISLLTLLAILAWTTGCKPPPPRLRRDKDGNVANGTGSNGTGSNTTGSNATGSNTTDIMPPVEDGIDDLGDPKYPTDDKTAAVADQGEEVAVTKKTEVDPKDWPYCRGPHYNNISYETGLVDDFDPAGGEGSNVTWFRDDLGTRSTPIVMNGKLYTLTRSYPGTASEGEQVMCLDAATGKTLWTNEFNVWLSDVPDTRVGWSSVVGDPETGNVYALGVCGYFQCINGETGKTIWSRAMHEEFGFLTTYGGRTNFPVVCDDQVIVSAIVIGWGEMAKPSHRFVSMNKRTGEVVWYESTTLLPDDTTYSPPALKTIDGQKQLILGVGDGMVWSLQPRTGKAIWKYGISRRGLNVGPFVVGDRIYTGQSEEVWEPNRSTMGSVVAIKAGQGDLTELEDHQLWEADRLMVGKSAPLVIEDRVYVFEDGGNLYILDAKTGKQIPIKYEDRKIEKLTKMRNMRSNPLYADGKIYAVSEAGQWFIAQPDVEKGLNFVAYSGRDKSVGDTNASPIASHGRVYLTTTGGIYCLEDKSKEHGLAEAPAQPAEADVKDDQTPALVQVVPAEVLMRPGEQVAFTARLYNAHGQFLSQQDFPLWSVEGVGGNITRGGKYTAPEDAAHKAAILTCTVGDISGVARIRIIPDLPWEFDFEKAVLAGEDKAGNKVGEPPVTWVGMRYRHVVREKDGNKVMVKVNTIPKGTRSQGWIGPPDLHDYTIQADVMGAQAGDQLPEIGITAQGYTLAIQGNNQLIQIRTWVTQERLSLHAANRNEDGSSKCKFPFAWKANKWYTMKFKVSNEDLVTKLQGKVWLKDDEEPSEWTIECEDPSPQRVGAPGFYGDANFAEIFIDNVKVTANE